MCIGDARLRGACVLCFFFVSYPFISVEMDERVACLPLFVPSVGQLTSPSIPPFLVFLFCVLFCRYAVSVYFKRTSMIANHRTVPFVKMNGLGNDFVMFDLIAEVPPDSHQHADADLYHVENGGRVTMSKFLHQHRLQSPRSWEFPKGVLRGISNRQRGVGCDQLVILCDGRSCSESASESQDTALEKYVALCAKREVPPRAVPSSSLWCAARIFNGFDGEEVGMCGNALRCIALYWYFIGVLELLWNRSQGSVDDLQLSIGDEILVILPHSRRLMPCKIVDPPLEALLAAFQKTMESYKGETTLFESVKQSLLADCLCEAKIDSWDVRVDIGKSDTHAFPALVGASIGGASPIELSKLLEHLDLTAPSVKSLIADSVVGAYAVSLGNPHCVLIAKDHLPTGAENVCLPTLLTDALVDSVGVALNHWTDVFPTGANIEFVTITKQPTTVVSERGSTTRCSARMRVYERGAGRTLACGSGACATGVALHAHMISIAHTASFESLVEMDGGELRIGTALVESAANKCTEVQFCGSASFAFFGNWLPLV